MNAPAHSGTRRTIRALAWMFAIATQHSIVFAQSATLSIAPQFEARIDALAGPPAGAQLGIGANVAAGYYIRIGLDAAAGASSRDGSAVLSGRVDLASRFLLDPFRESAWAPYAGGGFTAQWDRDGNRRGDLLLLIGLEGPAHAGWRTAVELGLGGGARLGVVLRRARSNSR
jgi:hypothetical protein